MRLVQKKLLIIMLMLVALVGQALAGSTMPCVHESVTIDMPMMTHVQMLNMSHAKATILDEEQDHTMACCQEQCQCPMSGCITVSLLFNYSFSSLVMVMVEQKIAQLSLLPQSQISASLYRPPIS